MADTQPTSLSESQTQSLLPDRKRASRYRRSNDPEAMRLMERDKQVVKAVNDYRMMRQDQIQRLVFPSRNTAQPRLRKLWEHGYLRRRFLPVMGGIQTSPIVYEVDRSGVALLLREFHYAEKDLRFVRPQEVSQQFVYHSLGLAEIRLAFELSCRKHQFELKTWWDEKALKVSFDRVMVGKKLEAVLPDAFLVVRVVDQRLLYFFIEFDRGLENLKFIRKKMAAYVAYFRSPLCEQRFGTTHIRVLTICEGKSQGTPSARLQNLKKTTEEVGGTSHFYLADLTNISNQDILFELHWQIAGGTDTAPLLMKSL